MRASTLAMVALIGVVVAFWGAGCGPNDTADATAGSDAGTDPGSDAAGDAATVTIPATGPLDVSLYSAAVAEAICSKVIACECSWIGNHLCEYDDICATSYVDCTEQVSDRYELVVALQQRTPEVVYDPNLARACVDYINTANCNDVDYHNECLRAWPGTVPLGSDCTTSIQCEGYRENTDIYCDGQCRLYEPYASQPGAACSGTCLFDAELEYMWCVTDMDATGTETCYVHDGYRCYAGTCVPLGELGDPCSGEYQCVSGAACIESVCSPPLAPGDSCWLTSGDNPCETGYYCSPGSCVPQVDLGEPCTSDDACSSKRCQYGVCAVPGSSPICIPEDW